MGVAGVHKLKACQSCLSRSHSLNCTCGYSMSVVCTYTVPCISCISNETLKSTLRHSFEGSVELCCQEILMELCCQEILMAWQLLYMYTVHDIHEIHGPVYVQLTYYRHMYISSSIVLAVHSACSHHTTMWSLCCGVWQWSKLQSCGLVWRKQVLEYEGCSIRDHTAVVG